MLEGFPRSKRRELIEYVKAIVKIELTRAEMEYARERGHEKTRPESLAS